IVAAEKRATIEGARRGTNAVLPVATGFTIAGTRRSAAGTVALRYSQKGAKVRLELEGPQGVTVSASNGTVAWRKLPEGTIEELPRTEADVLEGNARALEAVLREGGEADLTELEFTGGETIDGRRTSRLATRDKQGRRRKLYFDATTGVLAGFAYPNE